MADRRTLIDLIAGYPENRRDETALIFLDREGAEYQRFTFAELERACRHVAQNLLLFSREREIVLLPLDDQAQFVTAFFGCLLAGKVPAPLPSIQLKKRRGGWGRLAQIIRQQPGLALMLPEGQFTEVHRRLEEERLPQLRLYPLEALSRPTQIAAELPALAPEDIAYIQFTSGSTSAPKGIVLTHGQVMDNMARMYRVFDRGMLVKVAGWIPFYHDMGLVGHLFTALFETGLGVFLPPAAFLARPELWLEIISRYQANSAAAPTFAFEHCVRKIAEDGGWDLSSWKYAYVGSETVTLPILDRFARRFAAAGFDRNTFRPVYGLAEVTLLAAGGHEGLNQLQDRLLEHSLAPGLGRTLVPYTIDEATTITIHDPASGERLPEGAEGEVHIACASNFAGYLPKSLPAQAAPAAEVRTGDLGFVREGCLYLTGRLKETLIIRGVNYSAEDLESAARAQQPELRLNDATACVSLPTPEGEKTVVFQEVQRHLEAARQQAVVDQIRANLSDYFAVQPDLVALVPQGLLPRTSNHKIARLECVERYQQGQLPLLLSSGHAPAAKSQPAEATDDPVVIVGMACRFPGGADTLEKFWELLTEGRDAIVEVPASRWDNSLFFDENPAVPGKVNTNWGGFIDRIDHFDPGLFGISPYEATEIDPQQRLVLETAWRLIEHTGWKKAQLQGSNTGVFIGISTNDYLYMKIKLTPGLESFNAYAGLGNAHSVAANRVSYFFDLKGPSMAVDTACSSSLTAFHLGATAILRGDCEQAMVGGVNAILSPGSTVTLSQFGMMAPDGRCKTFDASANGYVRSEGCGLVMLKRRSAALRDGDRILATLLASRAGQDGASPGITYPNGDAQHRLIQQTLRDAGIMGADVTYVEAHGTGTASGDPVEMEQLRKNYGLLGDQACYVGSVKANIGHLESAAGIAGVIKAVLMLAYQRIPPQVHLRELNPKIRLEGSRLRIARELETWTRADAPRRVAVSSFGFGGSLAHALLEEAAPVPVPETKVPRDHHLYPLVLSAVSPEGLVRQAEHWKDWLAADPLLSLPDLCQTQAITRSDLNYRTCLLADGRVQLLQKLEDFLADNRKRLAPARADKLCFLFTGQGEHYLHMGKELYYRFPRFQAYVDRCFHSLSYDDPEVSLRVIAFEREDTSQWREPYMQPLVFAIQYALGRFCEDLGLRADTLLGYSFGEYAAACLAGCFEPEDGMRILRKRGELLESLSAFGHMATLFTHHSNVSAVMDPARAEIAVINSDKKTVVAGEPAEIKRLCDHFVAIGVEHYLLKTSQAYHSRFVDPILDAFGAFLQTIVFRPPARAWLSPVKGGWMTEAPSAQHWVDQLRNPVLFAATAEQLPLDEATWHFMEIGPGASTLAAINDHLAPKDALLLRTLVRKRASRTEDYHFLDSLGRLYEAGFAINWAPIYQGQTYPARIPVYQFQHRPYWVKGIDATQMSAFAINHYQGKTKANRALVNGHHGANGTTSAADTRHYTLAWKAADPLPTMPLAEALAEPVTWIIIGPDTSLVQALRNCIRPRQKSVYWLGPKRKGSSPPDIALSEFPTRQELFRQVDRVINLQAKQEIDEFRLLFVCGGQSFPADSADLNAEVGSTAGTFVKLLQALKELVVALPVWLITEDAQAVDERSPLRLSLAPVWGLAKTAYLEHPEWRGGLIDVSAAEAAEQVAEQLVRKIIRPKSERCVLLRDGRQWIEQIQPYALPPASSPLSFRDDGAFIITGGLGGLGLETAHWVADKGGRHLILISRRELPPMAEWADLPADHPRHDLVQRLLPLREKVDRLEIISQDIRDQKALAGLFQRLDESGVPVRGVLHAAGVNWFSKIIDMDEAEFLSTLDIKVAASWTLHQLTKDRDLDCFVLFSSVSALWGSVELSHYTAANYFLDMLALHRHRSGLPALSIDWGPWAEVGMSAGDREVEVLQKLGFNLIPPGRALEAMEQALVDGQPLYLVGEMDWGVFKPFIDFSLRPSLFEQLVSELPEGRSAPSEGLTEILRSSPEKARRKIEEVVRMELRRVMLIESMDRIDDQQRFNFLGMDSLMAISFVVEIEQFFDIKLPNTLPYNYPHIRAVSDYLFETVYQPNALPTEAAPPAPTPAAEPTPEPLAPTEGEWLQRLRPAGAGGGYRLYCFPYAGSGVSVYGRLAIDLPSEIDVWGVQPPGREERAQETPFDELTALAAAFAAEFEPPDEAYAFFGHSLGGLMAYEVYLALERAGKRLPERLLLSGCGAPADEASGRIHELPDEEMVEEILHNYENGQATPQRRQAILNIKALVRADIRMLETHRNRAAMVRVPLVVVGGRNDRIAPPERVRAWLQLADREFFLHLLAGKHDLIHECRAELVRILRRELTDAAVWEHEANF